MLKDIQRLLFNAILYKFGVYENNRFSGGEK